MTLARRVRAALLACLTSTAIGCDAGDAASVADVPLLLEQYPLATGSVLSLAWTVHTRHADSVAVRFGLEGSALDGITPSFTLTDDTALVAVLGLLPDRRYDVQLVLFRGTQMVQLPTQTVETGSMPTDLPTYHGEGPDPAAGYVVFSAGSYGLAIDNTGRVVWYNRLPDGPNLAFMPTGNGTFVARPATPDVSDRDPWIEMDVLGRPLRTLPCVGNLVPRPHDLLVMPDESYWIMCDEVRPMDLALQGGPDDAQVLATMVQHVARTGELLFSWSAFEHLDPRTIDPAQMVGSRVNWTHGNAITMAPDGDIVVSFRNLNQVVKIDPASGALRWKLGGTDGDITIAPAEGQPFFHQHGIRVAASGDIVMLDNLGESVFSRVERYQVDQQARVAILGSTLVPQPLTLGTLGGSVQLLPDGHVLVSFGNGAQVTEYDGGGNVAWKLTGDAGYVFRAARIRSLYRPSPD